MTDTPTTPQEGVARAVNQLEEQTIALVRQELEAVRDETIDKVKQWVPAIGALGLAAGSGAFATASLYRFIMRIFDRLFGPALGALLATAAFGGTAFLLARKGVSDVKKAPVPLPTATASATAGAVSETLHSI